MSEARLVVSLCGAIAFGIWASSPAAGIAYWCALAVLANVNFYEL